jgi:hypothetical protein
MRKLRIGIIDLASKGPTQALWARVMNANLSSIMPQVVGVWCQRAGHEVEFICYTGFEDLMNELPENLDLLFIGAFTEAALLAYAISARVREQGVVTVLGGPHARCYPQDAQKYFDYVLGFTDEQVIREVLTDCSPNRPLGIRLSASRQPTELPGVRDRWEFIHSTLRKAPLIEVVPMLASVGCPYTCSFCIDSGVPYQLFDPDAMKDDLRFLLTKFKTPLVGWHDPNFGVRFDDMMDAIEDAVPPDSIRFIAESSLSLLSEPHLKRLKHNGFKAILPGIESWFDLGGKSRTGPHQGRAKVLQVADHINLILKYIPYVQTNFVLGLDCDAGPEPFELTKLFIDRAPGAFPGYSLLTAFGEAAPVNLEYQLNNRIIGFPFHFLDNHQAMNLRPRNYSWPEFYARVIDLTRHSFSARAILRRVGATNALIPRWLNIIRAMSSEGYGRLRYYRHVHHQLSTDRGVRDFFEQESDVLPQFYVDQIQRELGPMWHALPEGAIFHDPYAYAKSQENAHVRLASAGGRS